MTRRHFRRFVFYPVMLLTGLIALIWLAAPVIAKHYLTEYFARQNAHFAIDGLSIDFFPPKIELENLVVSRQKNTLLTLESALLEVKILPLVNHTLRISGASIEGLKLLVEQQEQHWMLAGIKLDQESNKAEALLKEAERLEDAGAIAGQPWRIELPRFTLANSEMTLSRQVDLTQAAQIDRFSLNALTVTQLSGIGPDWQGEVALSGRINAATFDVASQFDYSPEQLNASVSMKKMRLPIASVKHFLPAQFNAARGRLGMDGQFQLSQAVGEAAYELSNINLNARAEQLDLALNEQQHFATESTTIALTQGKVQFLAGKRLQITGGLELESQQTQLAQASQNLQFASLNLSLPLELTQDEQGLTLTSVDSKLALADLSLAQADSAMGMDNLSMSLKNLAFALDPQNSVSLSVDSTLESENLSLTQADSAIGMDNLDMSLKNLVIALDPQNSFTVSVDSAFESEGLSLQQANISANYQAFNAASVLVLTQQTGEISVQNSMLAIELNGFEASQIDGKQVSLDDLQLSADKFDMLLADKQAPSLTGANINMASQSFDSLLASDKRMAAWQSANLTELSFHSQGDVLEVAFGLLDMAELRFSEPLGVSQQQASSANNHNALPPLAHIGRLQIAQLNANEKGANIHIITAEAVNTKLLFDAQSRLENLVFMSEDAVSAEEPSVDFANDKTNANNSVPVAVEEAPTTLDMAPDSPQTLVVEPAYYLILEAFDMLGDSSIYLQDQSIEPILQRTLAIEALSLRKLNTQDKQQATVLSLQARQDKYTTIKSDITLWPLAERLTMESKLEIKEAELPPYSSYIAKVLGYQIDSGQLDLALKLKAQDGVLQGNSHIILREFDLGGRQESSAMMKSGAVPLNITVGILKDSNDNIELNIPLSGNVDNPEFGWQNFLIQPVRNALFKASSNYVLQTFVPYANVITIVQFAGEQLLKIRVEPLVFEAGNGNLTATQTAYLEQLSALMQAKPDSQLKACGVSSYLDFGLEHRPESLDQTMQANAKALAQQRASNLKDYLVQEGIRSARIFLCSPAVDLAEGSKPRVELNF